MDKRSFKLSRRLFLKRSFLNTNKLIEICYTVYRENGSSGISEVQVSLSTFLLKTVDDFVAFAARSRQTGPDMPLHPQIYFPHLKLEKVHKIKVSNANEWHDYYQY